MTWLARAAWTSLVLSFIALVVASLPEPVVLLWPFASLAVVAASSGAAPGGDVSNRRAWLITFGGSAAGLVVLGIAAYIGDLETLGVLLLCLALMFGGFTVAWARSSISAPS